MNLLPGWLAELDDVAETKHVLKHRETDRDPVELDYKLAGQLIREEIEAKYDLIREFTAAMGVSRVTTHRILTGAPDVQPRILRDVERILGWPRFTIDAIREHKFAWLTDNGLPDALVTRAQGLAAREAPGNRMDD